MNILSVYLGCYSGSSTNLTSQATTLNCQSQTPNTQLASTRPSPNKPIRSSNTSASPDNTNISPSWRFPRSNTHQLVWPTRSKNTSMIMTLKPTDVSIWQSNRQSLENLSNLQDPLLSPNPRKKRQPQLLLHSPLPKAQLLTLSISSIPSKISNNQWPKILLNNMRNRLVSLSLRSMANPLQTRHSSRSRQILLAHRRVSHSWHNLLPNCNRSLQVLDSVVTALSRSNKCNRSRLVSLQIHSSLPCNSLSKLRSQRSNSNHPFCNKTPSARNPSNKILLACNSNNSLNKCNPLNNRYRRRQLILSANP